jgi:hypothetical protein
VNSSFVEYVAGKVLSASRDEQIAGLVLKGIEAITSGRPNYFFLTDLVNPQQNYWAHIGVEPEPSDKLQAAFGFGRFMQAQAAIALAQISGFAGSEGVLDGAAVGLPGIRGRADFRIGDSLWEFKTTRHRVDDPEHIWDKVPQDIEQILFYAALWTYEARDHHLFFFTSDSEEPLRVFKTTINNRGALRNTLKQRRDALAEAVRTKDPSRLRRCRYYEDSCPIREAGHCDCENLQDWPLRPLQEAVEVVRDEKVEDLVAEAWQILENFPPRPISPWELEVPRRAYGRLTGKRPEEGQVPFKKRWIWRALRQSELLPGPAVAPLLPVLREPLLFKAAGTYLLRKVTKGEEITEKLTPTLIREWDHDYAPRPRYRGVRNYLMQLGVLCALSARPTGALILHPPEMGSALFVHLIQFKDLGEIKRKVRARLTQIAFAVENSDPSQLPQCPKWLKSMECDNCLCR